MDASIFARALLIHKPDSRADLLALLPAKSRTLVEAELARIADLTSEQVQGSLRSLRMAHAARGRTKAEERLGLSLKDATPRLALWLARPF